MAGEDARLQLHLDPNEPIEVTELTAALGALARQYQKFALENELAVKTREARLLVSNVSPGSIDISFVPDFVYAATAMGPLLAPLLDKAELVEKFAKHIKTLTEFFKSKEKSTGDGISVRDCDDVANIVKPTASHGGNQTFNIIKGDVKVCVLSIERDDAIALFDSALSHKASILGADGDQKQRVPLVWKRLDRDDAKVDGKTSPDRGVIEEIDPRPHPVLFTDEMLTIKREMIDDEVNPYQNIYFVDVQISRVQGKIVSYRVTGYHGKEELSSV